MLGGGAIRPGKQKVFLMEHARLESTVQLLKEVRTAMRDAVDARVIDNLDEAIEILETEATTAIQRSARRKAALSKLGEALNCLPVIRLLIDSLLR